MAKAWLAELLSELHRDFLKPAGFGKERNTFSRRRGDYVERFNFQGSSWSSSAETGFYLNVGVEFDEFEPAERDWLYFKWTHWASRIAELVPGAPDNWWCTGATDRRALKHELAQLVAKASEQIAARIAALRASYVARMQRKARRREEASA